MNVASDFNFGNRSIADTDNTSSAATRGDEKGPEQPRGDEHFLLKIGTPLTHHENDLVRSARVLPHVRTFQSWNQLRKLLVASQIQSTQTLCASQNEGASGKTYSDVYALASDSVEGIRRSTSRS
jgi:hypothetical protein